MRRVISVWLPNWPIDRLRHSLARQHRKPGGSDAPDNPHPGHRSARLPFALVTAGRHGLNLHAVNGAADLAGLGPGMALTDARAMVPDLVTCPADLRADAEALRHLADWCGQFTPWVSMDGTNGLWLDISGCAGLFGGETGLMHQLTGQLSALGIDARTGLADTPGAAWALARYGRMLLPEQAIIPSGGQKAALAGLPIEGLRLTAGTAMLLKRMGLATIGSLYALPRAGLRRRFPSRNEAEAVLERLDQALGHLPEPLSPLSDPASYRSRIALAQPISTREAIDQCLDRLMAKLIALLEKDGLGARRLSLSAYRVDGRVERVPVALGRPSREARHFRRLFAEKLGNIDPGFGIDVLILGAEVTGALAEKQIALTSGGHAPLQGLDQLTDRLVNRLGHQQVFRLAAHQSHIPERAQKIVPALDGAQNWKTVDGKTPPRPHRLLPRPERIEVMAEVPEGPPLRFLWRRIPHQVMKAEGPERIAPEWWRETAQAITGTRDYYRVEDERGRRFWLFRKGLYTHAGSRHPEGGEGSPQWYLHGFFA